MKIALFISFLFFMSCSSSRKASIPSKSSNNHVVAHRGAFKKNGFPENSIASLREAIRLQCAGSEFDVRMTADDSLIINHDPKYKNLDIEKSTYAELSKFKLSNGEMLPTLHQLMLAGLENNRQTQLVVEIKPSEISKDRGRLIAERVVRLIQKLGAEKMVAYISFDYGILKKIQELDRRAITQYLNGEIAPDQLKADGITGADYNMSVFKKNPDWVESAKKNKLILNTWTVNTEADMKWFLERDFDFITTNEPELLLELVKGKR